MPDRIRCALLAALLVSSGSCGDSRSSAPEVDAPVEGGILVSDRGRQLLAELEEADRRFARDVRERGLDAWVEAFAQDGAVLPAYGPIAIGPEAIRELFTPVFDDPGFEIHWTPAGGQVSSSGDLGCTFGSWQTDVASDGETAGAEGKYITVWRRDEDGAWRVALDIGNTGTR